VAGAAVRRLIRALLTRGRVDLPEDEMMTFAQVKQALGLDDVLGLREKLETKGGVVAQAPLAPGRPNLEEK
jgi:hypothetical protein